MNSTIPQGEILIADMGLCDLAYLPYNGQALVIEPLAKIGAQERQQIYGQMGLDYGLESKHGKLKYTVQ